MNLVVLLLLETTVRPPRVEECTTVYKVFETGAPAIDQLSFDGFSRWWNRSRILGDLPALWRVATIKEEIVGVAINMILDGLGWGAIWELAVSPDWRGKGIGTRLVVESEKALSERNRTLTHYVMGVKAHNHRAIPFIERLGYGIQSLVLRLDGCIDQGKYKSTLDAKLPRLEQIPILQHLIPDTYWGLRDQATLEYAIRGGHCHVFTQEESNMIVGFARLETDYELEDATVVTFSFRPGYGKEVVEAAMNEVPTKNAVFWVQDKHEEILDHLYTVGFKRAESEYLAKKRITSVAEQE